MESKRERNPHIRWFDEIGIEDIPLVGGKNASLGEMYRELTGKGVNVPNGFAVTADAYFAEIFDGFSIGFNDLTQLVLGTDRDSAIVAHLFDERNPAVMRFIEEVIRKVQARGRKIGICGQAPSDYPEFARFLVSCGIDSISLNPDTVLRTTREIVDMEKQRLASSGPGAKASR